MVSRRVDMRQLPHKARKKSFQGPWKERGVFCYAELELRFCFFFVVMKTCS